MLRSKFHPGIMRQAASEFAGAGPCVPLESDGKKLRFNRLSAAAARSLTRGASGAAVPDAIVIITCDAGTHSVNEPIFKVCAIKILLVFCFSLALVAVRHACSWRPMLEARVHQLQ